MILIARRLQIKLLFTLESTKLTFSSSIFREKSLVWETVLLDEEDNEILWQNIIIGRLLGSSPLQYIPNIKHEFNLPV